MNINVNMNGKEYLEYTQRKKWLNNLTKKEKIMLVMVSIIIVGAVCIGLLLQDLNAKPIAEPVYFYFFNVPILESAPSILLLFAGMGWIIHGTGFFVVKR